MKPSSKKSPNDSGNCFRAAAKYILDPSRTFQNNWKLVHGHVTGTKGAVKGIRYSHAWVEHGDLVYDVSNDREVAVPKDLYYAMGQIESQECFYYTPARARKFCLDTEHWGAWELEPTEIELAAKRRK